MTDTDNSEHENEPITAEFHVPVYFNVAISLEVVKGAFENEYGREPESAEEIAAFIETMDAKRLISETTMVDTLDSEWRGADYDPVVEHLFEGSMRLTDVDGEVHYEDDGFHDWRSDDGYVRGDDT